MGKAAKAEQGLSPRSEGDEADQPRRDQTKRLPTSVLLSLLEWLWVSDLLAVARVDRSFRDLAKDETLWKAASRGLWKLALLEGQMLGVEALGSPTLASKSRGACCRGGDSADAPCHRVSVAGGS